MMTNCPDIETIVRYVGGELTAEESTRFEAHSSNCPRCCTKTREVRQSAIPQARANALTKDDMPAVSSVDAGDARRIVTAKGAQSYLGEQYKVVKKVGEGASGEVFLAIDTVLERSVAVKFLSKITGVTQDKQIALHEGRLMSKLNHPNVAQIYQIGQADGVHYIVMEWVEGVHITEAWRDMSLGNRLGVYLEVLEAMEVAHRRNIIHRDIKPSNILVTASGKVKVLDFGLAIELYSLTASDTKAYQGTPAYSAPEQISSPSKICSGTDVFALGILLYQLLTDELPFPQLNLRELFEAINTSHPELPSAIQQAVPIPLQNICLKALEKDIGNRYQDGHALAADIMRYLRGEKVWSRPTFLADKIQQEVHYHDQRLSVWRDNELITEREYDKLSSIYDRVVAPSDPSIIESRKLSFSQVSLYLGGWITVIGSAVLLSDTWPHIPESIRPIPAVIAVLIMLICGRLLWRKEDRRLAVGFLATGNLLLPVVVVITLAHWHILDPHDFPLGTESFIETEPLIESLETTSEPETIVVGNWHLLVSSLLWIVCSLSFTRIVRSSIFVIFSILAFFALLTTGFIINGMQEWDPDIIAGRYLFSALGIFVFGAYLDRRKRTKYAWPLCLTGVITIVVCLSVIASSESNLFGWLWPGEGQPPDWYWKTLFLLEGEEDAKWLGFCCNGVFYLTLAWLCRRQGTRLQRTLAQVFNWLGPLHILGALRILDDMVFSSWRQLLYRLLLPVGSILFVFGSVARQMKSFFFSGLLGIAAAIQKFTDQYFKSCFSWPVGLIASGILCMFISWWLPHLQASKELKPAGRAAQRKVHG